MEQVEIRAEADRQEHDAWVAWCKEFKRITGLDINEKRFTPMCDLIYVWGAAYIERHKAHAEKAKRLSR